MRDDKNGSWLSNFAQQNERGYQYEMMCRLNGCDPQVEKIKHLNGVVAELQSQLEGVMGAHEMESDHYNTMRKMYDLVIADNAELRSENKDLKEILGWQKDLKADRHEILANIHQLVSKLEDME